MLEVTVGWPEAKGFIDSGLPFRWVLANGAYRIYVFDSRDMAWVCILPSDAGDLVTDFVDNYSSLSKQPIVVSTQTQFERTDITLKIAKTSATVVDGRATMKIKALGDFGSGISRYAGGGYCMLDSFDPDDYITIRISDEDRNIAWMVAQSQDPSATEPVADEVIRGMGEIPGVGAFPQYPVLRSYTDDEQEVDLQGWYFWPLALGGTKEAYGEVEIDPLGFYGEVPAGLWILLEVVRPNVTDGNVRACIYWGKAET